ncbi:MAG TPA: acyl-CoA dehydrogenase family protein [Thermoanaerobaculia bacterium]|jgi:alkylation response protein AidB-like acyl-CoA dehydrogenase|nr:acyl-CoA dehydrogenase family protein [Thermoanaerobaculia bacterium]
MAEQKTKGAIEAMEVAEASRETEWEKPSFVGDLFLGKLNVDLIHPFPEQPAADKAEADDFLNKMDRFLSENVDADAIDAKGEYDYSLFDGLNELGAWGMKIPKEYGGLGFSATNYNRAIGLVATWCGSTVAWLSAHQSIGVPQPLKLFGTPEQKQKYLPRLAKGAISAFALTEPGVGSDPAKMETMAVPSPDGKGWILNGEKLWCTNGLKAEVIVVMAQTPPKMVKGKEKKQISAFILETDTPGVEIAHRCQFMGLRGIGNVLIKFSNVFIPKENLLWGEGLGLKLALITLNTGRLTIPAGCAAGGRRMVQIAKEWANERVQWGAPIGKHEAVAAKISWMASHTFAMESIVWLTSGLADRGDVDLRLEAAMAKLFNTEVAWQCIDHLVQIRGGRGYETAASLRARGEAGYPVERIMRDMRINRIFEGTSEIQHLFIAREAVDPHMKRGYKILLPETPTGEKLAAAAKAGAHYAAWYPAKYLGWSRYPKHGEFGKLSEHMGFIERSSRHLARSIFHAMMRYQAKLERKQMVLFRLVDIGTDLFAMAASITYATMLAKQSKEQQNALDLADVFCREARMRVDTNFRYLFDNHDEQSYKLVSHLMKGEYKWLEGHLVEGPTETVMPTSEQIEEAIARMA